MTWIAISDGRSVQHQSNAGNALLPTGSLVLEAMPGTDRSKLQTLLLLDHDKDWRHRLSVTLTPGGEIEVEHIQGRSRFYAVIEEPQLSAENVLRVTIAWDAPQRIAHVTAEGPATSSFATASFADPLPLPITDVMALMTEAWIDPAVSLVAVADAVEPVGPLPSFLEGTQIETAAGPKPIERIVAGDLVPTASGRLVPVRRVLSRTLPALGSFRPITLRAPFLGLQADLTVAPNHRILLDGTDTEYLFGTETVLLEARHLGPVFGEFNNGVGPIAQYWQILLDTHECIFSSGTWSESLFVGTLRERPARHKRSALADVPAHTLPIHHDIAGPLLRPYEAMVLVSNLCA